MPTTSTDTRPDSPAPNTTEPEPFFGLGLAQILASTLAAVSAALAASFLGVAGTIIGAALGSLVATIGSAIYAHSLRTAGSRLQRLRPQGPGTPSPRARVMHGPARRTPGGVTISRRRWLGASAAVIAGFALALTGLTLAETFLGHPVSNNGTTGTTLSRAADPAPAPEFGHTPTPSASTAPSPATTTPAAPATTPAPTTATTTGGTATTSETSTPSSPTTSAPTGPSATPSAPVPAPPTSASTPAPTPRVPATLQP